MVLVVKDLHKVTSQIYIKQNNKLVLLRCTSWERCKCSTYYDIRAHTVVTFSAQTKKKKTCTLPVHQFAKKNCTKDQTQFDYL